MHSRLLGVALILALASPARAQEVTTEQPRPETYAGLRIAGFATFTSLYLTSVLNAVLTGAASRPNGFASSSQNGLFIPVAGPFVALFHPLNRNLVNVTFLAMDGIGQLAGATMLVLSFVLPRPTQTAWQILPGPGSLTLNVRWP